MSSEVAYWIGIPGEQPDPSEIKYINFGNDVGAPQMLAFKNEKCYWGVEVEAMLATQDSETGQRVLDQEDVISFLKITNYPSLEAGALAVDTLNQVEGLRGFFKLPETTPAHIIKVHALSAHLKGIYQHVRDSIKKRFTNLTRYGVEVSWETHLYLSLQS